MCIQVRRRCVHQLRDELCICRRTSRVRLRCHMLQLGQQIAQHGRRHCTCIMAIRPVTCCVESSGAITSPVRVPIGNRVCQQVILKHVRSFFSSPDVSFHPQAVKMMATHALSIFDRCERKQNARMRSVSHAGMQFCACK